MHLFIVSGEALHISPSILVKTKVDFFALPYFGFSIFYHDLYHYINGKMKGCKNILVGGFEY